MILFDRKFGPEYIQTVPGKPGVYTFANAEGGVVYVGKAKNLRKRLGQYRRARGGKMRKIVKAAFTLQWSLCESELDACLLELRQIQEIKPKLNIASNFSHRYPLIGILAGSPELFLCFTTTPEVFPDYQFYGAFRSRFITAEAFFSLIRLLQFVGHAVPRKKVEKKKYSYEFGLRRLPDSWPALLESFFRGRSDAFLEALFLKLLENAGARSKAEDIQEGIDALHAFWQQECEPLAKAIATVGFETYPVSQTERDPLFVRAGFAIKEITGEET